jgi:WD40 repeat protein/Ca2+-binding EF-hand superfamily protein
MSYIEESKHQYESDKMNDSEEVERINALNLRWAFGLNFTIYNGVHNLANDRRSEIFYAVGHTGVIYDYKANTQRLLQGHCNKITCTAYCVQEDLLVTADHGPDSMLVIWDAKEGTPRKTIFDPHPNGVECLDVTPDGRYIITVSKEDPNGKQLQTFTLWDWRNEGSAYLISSEVHPESESYQRFVQFNPDKPQEFVSTGNQRIIFWQWDPKKRDGFEFYGPSYHDPKFDFTHTVFIPKPSTQAVTGTTDGQLVVWDISLIMEDYSQPEERRKIKIVNLMKSVNKSETAQKKASPAVNLLRIQGDYLVVGASNGSIRFYDFQYRIIAWFEDLGIGKITSISFSQESYRGDSIKNVDDENQMDKPFRSPEFIVVDTDCTVTLLRSTLFDELEDSKRKRTIMMKLLNSPIVTIAVRPHSYTMAISCKNGSVYEWNFHDRKVILDKPLRVFDSNNAFPTCLQYSPDGKFLAVAMDNGYINFYEVEEKKWQETQQQVSSATEHTLPSVYKIVFSPDSTHLAAIDDQHCVSLFRRGHRFGRLEEPIEWVFAGKKRVHLAKIRDVCFGESLTDQGNIILRLFSIGDDKKLVEYDVQGSTQEKLKLHDNNACFQIEQETNPCACIWYPLNKFKEDCLLTVNEEYKIKLWNVSNDDKISKKTCLGPTYGGFIDKFIVINGSTEDDKYVAYSTAEKVVGLIKLPVDGNPNRSMALIAHPAGITGIGVSSDGKYMLTSGGDDFCVNMWLVDLATLDQNLLFQSNTAEIFPELLEGGKEGQTYRDLKDFFYYSQIRSKDENTTKARKLEGKVPLDEIPNLMRALGYYPTTKEIENMQAEVKYSSFLETGEYIEECDLETFVRLFVNHRPVYGIGKQNIETALNTLTEAQSVLKGKISREEFIHILKTEGEAMTEEEIEACLGTLLGDTDIENVLPEQIDVDVLAKELLGFEELADEEEQQNLSYPPQ